MLVLARGPIRAGASAQFDLALVEVFLAPEPLGLGDFPVLIGRADLATPVQECLVMADDVLVEDGDVAPGRFKIQVFDMQVIVRLLDPNALRLDHLCISRIMWPEGRR